ncbi:MAG: hypothetical protein LUG45_07915 [Clostridiales bacterium]|nr:hypothetical protein [Clostridiales bacterium]
MDVKRERNRFTKGKGMRRPWYAREILRLLATLAITLVVGLCGWLLPNAVAQWKAACETLILSQTDFEQAFSDLGQMMTDGDLTGALEDWCAAVFSPQEAEDAEAESSDAAGESEAAPEATVPEAEENGNGQISEA